ncbi:hypothetical protein JKF63_05326 [Porcisia hertigi]|uniref:Uncharacterized protein n=1 Tax=Porcisia hertigi TaxID=2761500 RepID=A0A836IG33_9TRYP|nr:hypothetical protein JKF63_05326 [Porcisia hertigi]
MSLPSHSSPPAPMPYVAQQQELMRVYREELRLQQILKEQCRLLQCLTEAATGLFSWWRRGAATAAAEGGKIRVADDSSLSEQSTMYKDDTNTFDVPSASSLLKLHSGMVFYSLGELLQLWATTAEASDLGCHSEKSTYASSSAEEAMSQGRCHQSRREVHPLAGNPSRMDMSSHQHPPPWAFPARIGVPASLIGSETGNDACTSRSPPTSLLPPTPAQLIRYRVLDATCPLPVTHRLLLGSVDAERFSLLFLWIMNLTRECVEAMLIGRPDRHERLARAVSTRIEEQGSVCSTGADGSQRPGRAAPTPTVMNSEVVKTIGTKRSRFGDEGDLSCCDGHVVSDSWNALCASLIRVLSYVVAAATGAPVTSSEHQRSAEPQPASLASCMATAATSTTLRADLRLFLAEVAEVRDTVLEVKRYYCVADLRCNEDELSLKRPRDESLGAAASPPLASVAGREQPTALSNMDTLAYLAATVDAHVRKYL